ncbi:MAG: sulfite exporter TauE/SafE family protein [Armatimonadota bacterium]
MNTTRELPDWLKSVKIVIIVLIGFTISIMSGLLGVGGGILMIPTMIYMLGLTQHRAHGTSLAVMSPIVFLTSIYYATHGQTNWIIAIELAIGGVIGAGIGARLCAKVSANHLKKAFGILLLLMGIKILYDTFGVHGSATNDSLVINPSSIIGIILVTLLGVATGILSGLLGIGGGIIMIPSMVLLLGISQKMAQGISLAVIIPVSISGALIHAKHGNVSFPVGIWLAIGGIPGSLLGAHLAIGMNPMYLKVIFALLMFLIGTISVFKKPVKENQP